MRLGQVKAGKLKRSTPGRMHFVVPDIPGRALFTPRLKCRSPGHDALQTKAPESSPVCSHQGPATRLRIAAIGWQNESLMRACWGGSALTARQGVTGHAMTAHRQAAHPAGTRPATLWPSNSGSMFRWAQSHGNACASAHRQKN